MMILEILSSNYILFNCVLAKKITKLWLLVVYGKPFTNSFQQDGFGISGFLFEPVVGHLTGLVFSPVQNVRLFKTNSSFQALNLLHTTWSILSKKCKFGSKSRESNDTYKRAVVEGRVGTSKSS